MRARFTKMQGCGNDFVVLDERGAALGLSPARAAALADRRRGIGCDQLIALEPADTGADVVMRIRNPDGSEAGACGNATRCVATLLAQETGRRHFVIRTSAGDLATDLLVDGQVQVDMGPPRLGWTEIPLARPMDTLHLDLASGPVADPAAASMGNPHATFFVSDLAAVTWPGWGRGWSMIRCFPTGPISASPRCWPPTGCGCACGNAAPASPWPAAPAPVRRW